jgi:hypothetical protein
MRQIDIFQKVIHVIQNSTVSLKTYMQMLTHTRSSPKVTKVVIIITMNAQNGRAMVATMLSSPLSTHQLFSASAISVDALTNSTRAAELSQQSNNAIEMIALPSITRDGQNSNLEAALQACKRMRINIGILTETKLSTGCYMRSAYGYMVFATQTTHTNQGGIALIFANYLYFQQANTRIQSQTQMTGFIQVFKKPYA